MIRPRERETHRTEISEPDFKNHLIEVSKFIIRNQNFLMIELATIGVLKNNLGLVSTPGDVN